MKYRLAFTVAIVAALLAATSPADARINELKIAGDQAYVEIRGPAGLDLSSFHYLAIGDGVDGDSGVIETVIPLQGVVPDDGVYLAAGSSFRPIANVDFVTPLDFEQDDNVTHLVVGGFNGDVGMDLDTNDDCRVDIAVPWGRVVDGVALAKESNPPQTTECHYGGDALGVGLGFPIVGIQNGAVPNQIVAVPDGSNQYRTGQQTPGAQNSYFVHEDFADGQFDDFSPVSWSSSGALTIVDDGMRLVASRAAGARATTESGDLPARDAWSLRARVTLNDISGAGFAGVGVTGAKWASVFARDEAFGVGDQFESTTVPIGDMVGEEFVVQFQATPGKLTGHFWRPDAPGEFITVERTSDSGATFEPRLVNNAADETFHEVWVSTEPLPLPVPGTSIFADVNGDGLLNSFDIDYLSELVRGGLDRPIYDLDNNGLLDQEDRRFWVEEAFGTSFGDASLDGTVGFDDFLELSQNFGSYGGWSDGDFDGNGQILFADFLALSQNFGAARNATIAVPEPIGPLAVCIALGAIAAFRRKRDDVTSLK